MFGELGYIIKLLLINRIYSLFGILLRKYNCWENLLHLLYSLNAYTQVPQNLNI